MKKEYKNMLKKTIKKEELIDFIEQVRYELNTNFDNIQKLIELDDKLDDLSQLIWEKVKEERGVF